MECVINDTKVKLVEGEIYSYIKHHKCKDYRWYLLKGCVKNTGYRAVTINKKLYQYHRVVYKLHNPEWNIEESSTNNSIDHIDRNKLNNNIENLRLVTHQQNQWNNGGKCYYWHKSANKWQVRIQLNGNKIYGGLFEDEEDAIIKVAELKIKHHSF